MTNVISLQQLRIASPCSMSWEDMVGDDRSRYCRHCRLNVYNFASMTQREIEQLILSKEGRVCARLYQRRDGTMLVRDCPFGLAALRRRGAWIVGKVAAGLILAAGGFAWAVDFANPYRERDSMSATAPFGTLERWLREPPPMPALMGAILVCPPAPMAPSAPAPVAD
jgi:hypothetical protein